MFVDRSVVDSTAKNPFGEGCIVLAPTSQQQCGANINGNQQQTGQDETQVKQDPSKDEIKEILDDERQLSLSLNPYVIFVFALLNCVMCHV